MMVTNLCTRPSSTITLSAGRWVDITTIPNKPGTKYLVSAYVNVTGGTISMRAYGDLSASQRVSYALTASLAGPMSMYYSVKSGNPTVTVTNILICTDAEYQANKTLLDGIGYFTGNTMPLA
ncbi:hypothetical protein BBM1128_01780 [Bifidobacterium breve MCC 1128]|uniref:Uncharacterized protein n=2 Tax=Bifidobacterium breve TaxID=1685 RepID=A0A0L7B623_BIFBR|nr:hypothetical protein [Bifidobacterium breve]KOA42922.1 hypothetical protein BBM1128_01780 [Bifidobacterium breve MCC 1128]WEB55718.1 hypothetical protein PUW55_05030 [Bifidobacterium breve]